MGVQSETRDRIVRVLDGLPVTDDLEGPALHAMTEQPGVANPWDAWPVWDLTEVGGFTGQQFTTHWVVFVVMPAGDRAGLVAAGDVVTEIVAPRLSNELPGDIERVEPVQLTFEQGGVKPAVRIILTC